MFRNAEDGMRCIVLFLEFAAGFVHLVHRCDHRRVVQRVAWVDSFAASLREEGIAEDGASLAARLLEAAPEARRLSGSQAGRVLARHLSCNKARRRRHDTVMRLIAKRFPRVKVDTPLYKLSNTSHLTGRSRRVDLAIEDKYFVEVTVLAKNQSLEDAVSEKLLKYRDLPKPVVIAAHAVDGSVYNDSLALLEEIPGFDGNDDLGDAISTSLLAFAADSLREAAVLQRTPFSRPTARQRRRLRRSSSAPESSK